MTRTLKIHFEREHFMELMPRGYKLGLTVGVTYDGRECHNVVVFESPLAPEMNISLDDDYEVAATKSGFRDAVVAMANTSTRSIKLGQKYTLSSSWDGRTESDETAPRNGFLFINGTDQDASALLFKNVNGRSTAAFITPNPVSPQIRATISQTSNVGIWLVRDYRAGAMVDTGRQKGSIIDMGSESTVKISWNGSGFAKGG